MSQRSTDYDRPNAENGGTWAKIIIACAITAALNIFASGRQIGAFEERLSWITTRQGENFQQHEKIITALEHLAVKFQEHELSQARQRQQP